MQLPAQLQEDIVSAPGAVACWEEPTEAALWPLNLFSLRRVKALKFLWNAEFWGTLRCGRLGWAAGVEESCLIHIKIHSSSYCFCTVSECLRTPWVGGWGKHKLCKFSCRTMGISCCYCLPPSTCLRQWCAAATSASVQFLGSTERLFTARCRFPLAEHVSLSLLHGTVNLKGTPSLLLPPPSPEYASGVAALDGSSLQRVWERLHHKTPCLCALLSILRIGKNSPSVGRGPSLAAAVTYVPRKRMLLTPFYGTFIKHALTVCKCMVFKQHHLNYQMQSCKLCSSGQKASGGGAGCDSEVRELKWKESLAHVLD